MATEIVVTHTVNPKYQNDIIPVVTNQWHVDLMREAIKEANKAKMSDKHYSAGCIVAVDSKPFTCGYSRELNLDHHGAVDGTRARVYCKDIL